MSIVYLIIEGNPENVLCQLAGTVVEYVLFALLLPLDRIALVVHDKVVNVRASLVRSRPRPCSE